jgi:predicted Zn-dependent protease
MLVRKIVWVFCVTFFISSCSTSPTGRSQIKFFPKEQLNSMGVQAFDQLKKDQKISTKRIDNQFVQCVANYITSKVPKADFNGQWEVVVFDEPQINAFALPGGKIGVYKGLLNVTENQHQLAAVIGHEVGHVIAEHGNQRMSSNALIGAGLQVTSAILDAKQVANNQQLMSALGLGAQVGLQLPFGRAHESEADEIGLDLMAEAGFKPQEAVKLWQNMDKASGGAKQPELLSTHPHPATRIEQLQLHMTKANAIYRRSTQQPNC